MTRLILAAAVAVHGAIHLIGFVVPWRIAAIAGFPYRTTAVDGLADLGDLGVRLVGIIWLGCAIGFVIAGFGIGARSRWALPLTGWLAVVSLVVCVIGLPETAAGVVVNVAILGAVAWVARTRSSSIEVAR